MVPVQCLWILWISNCTKYIVFNYFSCTAMRFKSLLINFKGRMTFLLAMYMTCLWCACSACGVLVLPVVCFWCLGFICSACGFYHRPFDTSRKHIRTHLARVTKLYGARVSFSLSLYTRTSEAKDCSQNANLHRPLMDMGMLEKS
jgi:hypothetical protein